MSLSISVTCSLFFHATWLSILYSIDPLNAMKNFASEMWHVTAVEMWHVSTVEMWHVPTVEIHYHVTCLFKWWQINERYLNICVNFPDFIRPVKLPSRSQQQNNFAGQRLRVSGWGRYSDSEWRIICEYVKFEISTWRHSTHMHSTIWLLFSLKTLYTNFPNINSLQTSLLSIPESAAITVRVEVKFV